MTAFHLHGFCHRQTKNGVTCVQGAERSEKHKKRPQKQIGQVNISYCFSWTTVPTANENLKDFTPKRAGIYKDTFQTCKSPGKDSAANTSSKSPVLAAEQRMPFHCIETAGFCTPSLTRSQGKNTFSFSNTITCQTQNLNLLVTQTSKQRISTQHNSLSLLVNLLHLPFKAPCCLLPHQRQKSEQITNLIVL